MCTHPLKTQPQKHSTQLSSLCNCDFSFKFFPSRHRQIPMIYAMPNSTQQPIHLWLARCLQIYFSENSYDDIVEAVLRALWGEDTFPSSFKLVWGRPEAVVYTFSFTLKLLTLAVWSNQHDSKILKMLIYSSNKSLLGNCPMTSPISSKCNSHI